MLILSFSALSAGLVGGCSTSPRTVADPLDPAPQDFSVEAIVLVGDGILDRPEAHLRPGRFTLFADGTLYYTALSDSPSTDGSGYRRTLGRRHVANLWSHLQQLGLADPGNADPMVNFNLVSPPAGRFVHLLAITAGEDRWVFTRSSAEGEPTDPAVTALIRHLADLAWLNESGEEWVPRAAKRYDFGPDPYARYRDQ